MSRITAENFENAKIGDEIDFASLDPRAKKFIADVEAALNRAMLGAADILSDKCGLPDHIVSSTLVSLFVTAAAKVSWINSIGEGKDGTQAWRQVNDIIYANIGNEIKSNIALLSAMPQGRA